MATTRTTPAQFFRQVRQEVSKVTWPTRKETMITTAMVFVMVVLASLFFMAVDWILGTAVDWLFIRH
jgi:preprotein translocase subunit SecE